MGQWEKSLSMNSHVKDRQDTTNHICTATWTLGDSILLSLKLGFYCLNIWGLVKTFWSWWFPRPQGTIKDKRHPTTWPTTSGTMLSHDRDPPWLQGHSDSFWNNLLTFPVMLKFSDNSLFPRLVDTLLTICTNEINSRKSLPLKGCNRAFSLWYCLYLYPHTYSVEREAKKHKGQHNF